MAIFEDLFKIFEKNEPHSDLEDLYDKVNKAASKVKKIALALKKELAELKKGESGLELKKTEIIEDYLIPNLEMLIEKTEQRFMKLLEKTKQTQPVSVKEREELAKILELLKKIDSELAVVKKDLKEKERKNKIYEAFILTRKILKDFYKEKQLQKQLKKHIDESQLSPLFKKIVSKTLQNKEVWLRKDQLREFEKEAKEINKAGDPDWQIKFRRWWDEEQKPETDVALKTPHINTTVIFKGKRRKLDIRISGAAA